MKSKVFFVVGLVTVFFISTPAPAQQEEITLSTYYPAPFGEYDELCAEKLLVWRPDAAELGYMGEGDCHIGNSLIVGAGATGFSYEEIGGSLTDGTVLIKGNVGIGTTSPTRTLEIQAATPGLRIRPTVDSRDANIYLYTTQTAADREWRIMAGSGAPNTNFRIYDNTAAADRLNIDATGNVGIGTTTPRSKLDIAGTNQRMYLGSSGWFVINRGTPSMDLYFGENSDTGKYRFRSTGGLVVETGNVGIGTTSPQAKLHVADGSTDIIKADSSGIVDLPKQSACSVNMTADQNTGAAAGWIKIQFNNELFDVQNEFDTVNYRFTATKAGKYLVTLCVHYENLVGGTFFEAYIYKNGSWARLSSGKAGGSNWNSQDVQAVLDLSAGDYIEGYARAQSANRTIDGATTFLDIVKLQ